MNLYYTHFIIPLLSAAFITVGLMVFAWRRRHAHGARPFMVLVAAVTLWTLSYVLELSGADMNTKLLGLKLSFVGVVCVPTTWLVFAVQYTRRDEWLRWPRWLGLLVVPLATTVLVWTWDQHGLFWSEIELVDYGAYRVLSRDAGPLYLVHAVYSYALLLAGSVVILQSYLGLPRLFWGQKITLVASILISWAANAVYILNLSPIPGLDLTPFAFTLSGMGIAWSVFGFRLFELAPVAHEAIYRNLSDGFIMLDISNRVQDLNPAAAELLNVTPAAIIGKPAISNLPQLPSLDVLLSESRVERVELSLPTPGGQRDFELQANRLFSRAGDFAGTLVVLRDITYQKLTQQYLTRRTAFLEVFNQIMAAAATAEDLASMMKTALEQTLLVLEQSRGGIWIMEYAQVRGFSAEDADMLAEFCRQTHADQQEVLAISDWGDAQALEGSLAARYAPDMLRLDIYATLTVPVRSRGQCIGSLLLAGLKPREWLEEEISLLEAVGRQTGVVAERLLQLQETQDRNRLMNCLIDQSAALSRNFSELEALDAIKRSAAALLNPSRVEILLGSDTPQPNGLNGDQAATPVIPRPVLIEDTNLILERLAPEERRDPGYRALGTWPLVYEDHTLAVISLYYESPHHWSASELDVMQAFTRQAAITLENSRLLQSEREQHILAQALRDLATVVNSTLDYNEVLERILENLEWALPLDRADIMLVENGKVRIANSHGYDDVGLEVWARQLSLPVEQLGFVAQIVKSGEMLILPDVQQSPLWNDFLPRNLCRSYLGAPIVRKGKTIGLINVYSETLEIFQPYHLDTLRAFTDQAAVALENAALYAEVQEQAEESASLYRAVTRLFTPASSLTALAEEITQAVTAEFHSAHCSVLLYDEGVNELKVIAQAGYFQVNPKPMRLDGPGLTVAAFNTGEVVYAPDINQDMRYVSGTPNTRSELVFPLRVQGQVIGVLNLESPEINAFRHKDQRVLAAFADRAALAIENARLFSLSDRQLHQINLLNAITRASLEAFDFHIMLAVMVERLSDLFEADGCYIALWDDELNMVLPGTATGNLDEAALNLNQNGDEPGLVQLVLDASTPLAIENLSASPLVSRKLEKALQACGLGESALLGLPLSANRQRFGAILVSYSHPRRFQAAEIRLAEQATGLVALAIARARSLEHSQRRAQEAENLRQATAALTAALDLRQVLDNILDHLDQVVPYDRACVYLLEEQTLHAVASRGFPNAQQVLGYNFPSSNAIVQQIITMSRPLMLKDSSQEPRFSGWIEQGQVRGWMGVQLVIHGSLIGFLTLGSQRTEAFSREQANQVQAFANQAAAAIANARLFSEVQRLAITDPLTGLYNRRGLYEIGRREVERARRYKRPLSAIMLDIDHFKKINDTYKHATGDQVLRILAERCRSSVREVDLLGRYGGEEIVILLPETDRLGALRAAEHLREDVACLPFETEVGALEITISLGVADMMEGELDLELLIDRADEAMYAAKQAGRNQVKAA